MLEFLKDGYLPETTFPVRWIDPTLCTRCGLCWETCPTAGFAWKRREIPTPVGYGGLTQACINCGNCIAVCPSGAIRMKGAYEVRSGRYKSLLKGEMRYPSPLNQNETREYTAYEKNLTSVERIIFTRRSHRLFKEKAVPEELISRILEAGRFAPSAGNCQPYKAIVITNRNTIKEIEKRSLPFLRLTKNFYLKGSERRNTWKKIIFTLLSWIMVNKLDPRPMAALEKSDQLKGGFYFNAPAVILILKDKRGISNPDLDAGIYAQNIVLSAHSLGLGTCYISMPIVPLNLPLLRGFRQRIGIVYPYVAVTSIAVGYPKIPIDRAIKRDSPPVKWLR